MKRISLLTVCLGLMVGSSGFTSSAEMLPSRIELRDQFDHPQKLEFPSDRVTILTIADRKGSDQIKAWVTALKEHYAGRIEFRGIAQVGGVPSFLQGRIRRKFQESQKYPIMMDWTGKVCQALNYVEGQANVLVIDRKGKILRRFEGNADGSALKQARDLLDKALTGSESHG